MWWTSEREQIEPLLFDGAIGNLFRTVGAASKTEADLELHELANIISETVAKMDHQDFLKSLQGDEGFKTISDGLRLQGNFLAKEKPDGFLITSWSNLGLDDVNFGNRESVWLGICGKVGPAYMNFASLIETKWSKGWFEASVTLISWKDNGYTRTRSWISCISNSEPEDSCPDRGLILIGLLTMTAIYIYYLAMINAQKTVLVG